jgi:polyphosphate glucokinase
MSDFTLSIDCGGSYIKSCVLDSAGTMHATPNRIETPYPLSIERFLATIEEIAASLPSAARATIGLPGMIRNGVVIATPHYINEAGPHSKLDPQLKDQWWGFDVQAAVTERLGIPTKVLNDAEVHAAGVITGSGLEIVMTLGTGLGFAVFHGGKLSPHFELSHATLRRNTTYDTWIGERERKRMGNTFWSRRVRLMVLELRPVFMWDRLYIGGGNSHSIAARDLALMGDDIIIVPNSAGVAGGVRAWTL